MSSHILIKNLVKCLNSEGIDLSLMSIKEFHHLIKHSELRNYFVKKYPKEKQQTPPPEQTDGFSQINIVQAKKDPYAQCFFETLLTVKAPL